jgi:cytochrome d ubiquinol oxidase subunit II
MDLPLLSASFLAFTLTLYVILDGFDLGVGILLLLQPAKAARDHMVDSITPTWDGNETWIIMAGVTLLAAFPIAYSILLPAFYLPVIVMLLALGFRGVSFEFRVQSIEHRRAWDVAFGVGSLVAALMQGLILGGLMQGVTVQNRQFAGSVLDILRPLPIISGITLLFGYAVLGAILCESLPPCFCTCLCCLLRHSLHLCGQNPARHSCAVGLTWDRSWLPCWLICYCGRNVNGTVRKE